MKKIVMFFLILSLIFMTSCAEDGESMNVFEYFSDLNNTSVFADDSSSAYETCTKIIDAVEAKDADKIVELFASVVQSENETLLTDAEDLINFIEGDVVSYSSKNEIFPSSSKESDKGKIKKYIQFNFVLKSTDEKYNIVVRECIYDNYDSNNIGVHAVKIIRFNDIYLEATSIDELLPGITVQKTSLYSLYDVNYEDGMYHYKIIDESGNLIDEGSRKEKVEILAYSDKTVSVKWQKDELFWDGYVVDTNTSEKSGIITNFFDYCDGVVVYKNSDGNAVIESVWDDKYYRVIKCSELREYSQDKPPVIFQVYVSDDVSFIGVWYYTDPDIFDLSDPDTYVIDDF